MSSAMPANAGAMSSAEGAGGPEATTLMIKNVPRKHTPSSLLSEMETLWGRHLVNFVYVPCGATDLGNMGIAFVNFTSPAAMQHALAALSGKKWPSLRSSRPIKVAPAFVQGIAENITYCAHKVPADVQHEHLPLVWHEGEMVDFRAAVQLYAQPAETARHRHGRLQPEPWASGSSWAPPQHAPVRECAAGRIGPCVGGPGALPGAAQAPVEEWTAIGHPPSAGGRWGASPAGSWESPCVCSPPRGALGEPRPRGALAAGSNSQLRCSQGEGTVASDHMPWPHRQQQTAPGNSPRQKTPMAVGMDAVTTAGSRGHQLASIKQSASYQEVCREMAVKLRQLMLLVQAPSL